MAAMEEKCKGACTAYYNVPVLEHDYEEISSTGNMEMQSIHHELTYSQPVQIQAAETTPNRSTETLQNQPTGTLQNQPTETGQNQINEKNKTEKKKEATARCIPFAVILLTIVVVVMVVVLMMLIFTGKNSTVFSV